MFIDRVIFVHRFRRNSHPAPRTCQHFEGAFFTSHPFRSQVEIYTYEFNSKLQTYLDSAVVLSNQASNFQLGTSI